MATCIACQESVQKNAKICPHCSSLQAIPWIPPVYTLMTYFLPIVSMISVVIALWAFLGPTLTQSIDSDVSARISFSNRTSLYVGISNDGKRDAFLEEVAVVLPMMPILFDVKDSVIIENISTRRYEFSHADIEASNVLFASNAERQRIEQLSNDWLRKADRGMPLDPRVFYLRYAAIAGFLKQHEDSLAEMDVRRFDDYNYDYRSGRRRVREFIEWLDDDGLSAEDERFNSPFWDKMVCHFRELDLLDGEFLGYLEGDERNVQLVVNIINSNGEQEMLQEAISYDRIYRFVSRTLMGNGHHEATLVDYFVNDQLFDKGEFAGGQYRGDVAECMRRNNDS